ncbi:MAG: ferritin family protein [Desulfobacterales bacterium]
MNIFEIAKQIEKNGEKFYRDLAVNATNTGLKNIFASLAEDEAKHYIAFVKMEQNKDFELTDTHILKDAKAVFQNMKEKAELFSEETPQEEVYLVALENERKSIKTYSELLETISINSQKEVVRKIIEEEKKHAFLIENVIEFIKKPMSWIENAEFNHLDQY